MKKNMARALAALLVVAMFLVAPPWELMAKAASITITGTYQERLAKLKKKFPNGKYWNHKKGKKSNPDKYTSKPCEHHGNCSKGGTDYTGSCGCNSFNGSSIQCMGFAEKLGYDLFGTNPRTQWKRSYRLSNVKAGDILRYGTHTIFVTKVSGDTLTYADCNSDGHCKIRWNAKIKKSQIHYFSYIKHANNYEKIVHGTAKAISSCKITGMKSSYAYTGKDIVPKIKVKDGSKTLKKGTDYTIKLTANLQVGEATAKITGKGAYSGSVKKKFDIVEE